MNSIHQVKYRRFVIFLLLLVGLIPQMRAVFACESIDGVVQLSCCCDEPGKMNCEKGDNCDENTATLATATLTKSCCDISFHAVSISINTSAHSIQNADFRVKILDAPQPPPGSVSNYSQTYLVSATRPVNYTIISDIQTAKAGKSTYLHTLRLRI